MSEPVVQDCRGAVVDVKENRIVNFTMGKFWNHHEPLAHQINWDDPELMILDKADGSLTQMFVLDGQWMVASSGNPTAGGRVNKKQQTFAELFWETFHANGMQLPPMSSYHGHSFAFELCTLANRIVVPHPEPRLQLLMGRNLATGAELGRGELETLATACHWEIVKRYPFSNRAEMLAAAAVLPPMEGEGYVVIDSRFNRIKVKSPQYVIVHKMRGDATPRRTIELWLEGDVSEFLSYFEDMRAEVEAVTHKIEFMAANAYVDFMRHKDSPSRKDFALSVKKSPWAAITFKLYADKDKSPAPTDALTKIRELSISAIERMIAAMDNKAMDNIPA